MPSTQGFAKIINFIALTLGFSVLMGWVLPIPILVQLNENWVPMQFNTALGFVLTALAALSGLFHLKIAQKLFASLLLGICVPTLIQYSGDYDFGIDELFFTHTITTLSTYPGRMAPNNAYLKISNN